MENTGLRKFGANIETDSIMRAAVEGAPHGVLVIDETGLIRFVNASLESIFGYSSAELIGKPVETLLPESHRRQHSEHRKRYLEQPAARPMGRGRELAGRRNDGSPVFLEIGLNPVRMGEAIWTVATVVDISIHKQAAEALQQNENILHLFVENTPAAVAMFDRNMRYLSTSRRFREDYRLGDRNIVGLICYDVFPDLPERWKQAHRRALAGETLRGEDDPYPRSDGRMEWITWEIVPWRLPSGDIGGIILFSEVVTERKRQSLALQQAEAEIRLIADNVPAFIARVGTDRRYLYVNRRFEEMAGMSQEEMIGRHVKDVWGEAIYQQIDDRIQTVLLGQPVSFELSIPSHDGKPRWFSFSYIPDRGNEGEVRGYFVLAGDITEHVRAQRLEASNRALQDFAAVASHDLQAPIRRIMSYSQLMKAGGSLTGPQMKYSGEIFRSAKRMNDLVEALLENARLENQPVTSEVPFGDVLAEVRSDLEGQISAAGAVVTADALPVVRANRPQIYQLLSNLVSNALKFRREMPVKIHVGARCADEEWIFSVSDNGIGIEKRSLGVIFEMFRRLHRHDDIPGSGIGLSTCQKIVEAHGGRIWVESVHGEGSTFYFTMPRRRRTDGVAVGQKAGEEPPRFRLPSVP